jgi:hypothetical protein
MSLLPVILMAFLLVTGCTKESANKPPELYPLQQGRDFANTHFNGNTYRQYEFSLAQNPAHGDSGAFHGSFDDWNAMSWDAKIHYLPAGGFTHELPLYSERSDIDSLDVVYYEAIGYYIHQFGFGWDDGIGDDPGTPYFDGSSPNAEYYTSTWLRPR